MFFCGYIPALIVLSVIDSGVVIDVGGLREKNLRNVPRNGRAPRGGGYIARFLRCRTLNHHHPSAEGAVKSEGSRVRLRWSSVSSFCERVCIHAQHAIREKWSFGLVGNYFVATNIVVRGIRGRGQPVEWRTHVSTRTYCLKSLALRGRGGGEKRRLKWWRGWKLLFSQRENMHPHSARRRVSALLGW